jgi:hypothetical protein
LKDDTRISIRPPPVLEINDKQEFGGLLNRKLGRFGAFQNSIDLVSPNSSQSVLPERRGYVASLEDTNTIRFAFGRRLISLR